MSQETKSQTSYEIRKKGETVTVPASAISGTPGPAEPLPCTMHEKVAQVSDTLTTAAVKKAASAQTLVAQPSEDGATVLMTLIEDGQERTFTLMNDGTTPLRQRVRIPLMATKTKSLKVKEVAAKNSAAWSRILKALAAPAKKVQSGDGSAIRIPAPVSTVGGGKGGLRFSVYRPGASYWAVSEDKEGTLEWVTKKSAPYTTKVGSGKGAVVLSGLVFDLLALQK